eukprot:jgi/Mesen1/3128/ME000184S02189
MEPEDLPTLQLIDGAGNFNNSGLDNFVKHIKLSECGLSYAVVAIMGPQSSGKSTLLNHLFRTRFVEMDAFKGRSQTTQGVWLACASEIQPRTLVLDLEGTDGRERGEDDTTFEKQSSLFALAVADVVIVNMWCHDIGREQAANKPLLKTVFQVMMRLFTPRKTTLLFVIRDKTKTPLNTLDPILRSDIQKIWETVPKPEKYKSTPLSEFFHLEVEALSNFEEKEEQFLNEVDNLRQRFMHSVDLGGLAGDRRGVVPGSGFPISVQEMWRVIKENKDLDLPAHKVMVATVRCEEIAHNNLAELMESKAWRTLEEGAREGPVPGFGRQASALLHTCIESYDAEAAYFDEVVRSNKRNFLMNRARELIGPAYQALLAHHRAAALDKLKRELDSCTGGSDGSAASFAESARTCVASTLSFFDAAAEESKVEGAGWDATKTREKLRRDIDAHVAAVRAQKLKAVATDAEKYLVEAVADPAASLLDAAAPHTWASLRELLARETAVAAAGLTEALRGFELEDAEMARMQASLAGAGRDAIERRTREEANQALMHMKDRFNTVFGRDQDSMPRRWTGSEDIRVITREARTAAVRLLAVLAAVRLKGEDTDNIEAALSTLLADSGDKTTAAAAAAGGGGEGKGAPQAAAPAPSSSSSASGGGLAAGHWEKVPAEDTVLTPGQCRILWRQFKAETEYTISQAMQAQEASRRTNSWLPPPWAIVAMCVLGFNEFMALVRNPLLFIGLVLAYFLSRAMWVQLDVANDFQSGFLAGMLSLSTKFVPAMLAMMKRLIEEGQAQLAAAAGPHMHGHAHAQSGLESYKKEIGLTSMGPSSSRSNEAEGVVSNGLSSSSSSSGALRQRASTLDPLLS